MFQLIAGVKEGQRPNLQLLKDCPQELEKLMKTCWNSKPASRPGFISILETLDKIDMTSEYSPWWIARPSDIAPQWEVKGDKATPYKLNLVKVSPLLYEAKSSHL